MNQYLAPQFSGSLVQGTADAILSEFQRFDTFLAYLATLSIDTASNSELYTIGLLIGYPWPIYETSGPSSQTFLFSEAATFPEVSVQHGFADATNPNAGGGRFSSPDRFYGERIPRDMYRALLREFAMVKYNGLSMVSIASVCAAFNTNFTLEWGFQLGSPPPGVEDSDIVVTFLSVVSYDDLWIIRALFDRIATAPRVFILAP